MSNAWDDLLPRRGVLRKARALPGKIQILRDIKRAFAPKGLYVVSPGFQPREPAQTAPRPEAEAVKQMANACALPVAVAGALMPDAHVGYGLLIGGVLATDKAVIPYAVGVDIACRMKLTV
jgi:tRNA-splicing ligase RtcB